MRFGEKFGFPISLTSSAGKRILSSSWSFFNSSSRMPTFVLIMLIIITTTLFRRLRTSTCIVCMLRGGLRLLHPTFRKRGTRCPDPCYSVSNKGSSRVHVINVKLTWHKGKRVIVNHNSPKTKMCARVVVVNSLHFAHGDHVNNIFYENSVFEQ